MLVRMARLRLDPLDPFERQVEMEMARMRPVPQRVDDPQLDAGERGNACRRQIDEIGRIGHGAEPEAERDDVAMVLQQRHRR